MTRRATPRRTASTPGPKPKVRGGITGRLSLPVPKDWRAAIHRATTMLSDRAAARPMSATTYLRRAVRKQLVEDGFHVSNPDGGDDE